LKTHQVQQKTERRISAALRLVFVAALLLGQIALAFFLSTELRQRAAIIYTVLELAAFGYAVRIYNRTDGTSYKFGWIFLVLTVPVVGLILYFLWNGDRQQAAGPEKAAHAGGAGSPTGRPPHPDGEAAAKIPPVGAAQCLSEPSRISPLR